MHLLSKMIVYRLRNFCIGILISLLLWALSVNAGPYTVSSETFSSAVTTTETIFPSHLASPLNVGVAMIINKIKEINEQEGTFSADIALILRWKDPGLSLTQSKKVLIGSFLVVRLQINFCLKYGFQVWKFQIYQASLAVKVLGFTYTLTEK